jgi:hypothetical protein
MNQEYETLKKIMSDNQFFDDDFITTTKGAIKQWAFCRIKSYIRFYKKNPYAAIKKCFQIYLSRD